MYGYRRVELDHAGSLHVSLHEGLICVGRYEASMQARCFCIDCEKVAQSDLLAVGWERPRGWEGQPGPRKSGNFREFKKFVTIAEHCQPWSCPF